VRAVAFAPGGVTDTFARLMAQKLTEQLGKQVYVENIAGASGNLGTGQVEGGGRRLLDPVCVQLPCGQPDAWLRADRSQCRNNEQVHGGDVSSVVTQKGAPSLRRWSTSGTIVSVPG
jgi:Tripartite tricarboxylate transporter family receptor